jgi:hypothetical protein
MTNTLHVDNTYSRILPAGAANIDDNLTDHTAAGQPACELGTWHEGPCVPLASRDSFYDTP